MRLLQSTPQREKKVEEESLPGASKARADLPREDPNDRQERRHEDSTPVVGESSRSTGQSSPPPWPSPSSPPSVYTAGLDLVEDRQRHTSDGMGEGALVRELLLWERERLEEETRALRLHLRDEEIKWSEALASWSSSSSPCPFNRKTGRFFDRERGCRERKAEPTSVRPPLLPARPRSSSSCFKLAVCLSREVEPFLEANRLPMNVMEQRRLRSGTDNTARRKKQGQEEEEKKQKNGSGRTRRERRREENASGESVVSEEGEEEGHANDKEDGRLRKKSLVARRDEKTAGEGEDEEEEEVVTGHKQDRRRKEEEEAEESEEEDEEEEEVSDVLLLEYEEDGELCGGAYEEGGESDGEGGEERGGPGGGARGTRGRGSRRSRRRLEQMLRTARKEEDDRDLLSEEISCTRDYRQFTLQDWLRVKRTIRGLPAARSLSSASSLCDKERHVEVMKGRNAKDLYGVWTVGPKTGRGEGGGGGEEEEEA